MNRLKPGRVYVGTALLIAIPLMALHAASLEQLAGTSESAGAGFWVQVATGIQSLEGRATDFRFKVRGERPVDPRVLVVEIDEKSTQKYGLWPWPRELMARALNNLVKAEAAAIGLDATFTDSTGASEELTALASKIDALPAGVAEVDSLKAEIARRLERSGDQALETALRAGKDVIIQGVIPFNDKDVPSFSPETRARYSREIGPWLIRTVKRGGAEADLPIAGFPLHPWNSAQTPLARFSATGTSMAHFDAFVDLDGTIRRSEVLAKLSAENGLLPSLGLKTAAVALGDDTIVPEFTKTDGSISLNSVRLTSSSGKGESRVIPLDSDAPYLLLDYPGPGSVYPQLSISDVIENTFDPARVKGKAVLVGVTTTGNMGDQRVTPFKGLEAGVFTHAAVLSNILANQFRVRVGSAWLLELIFMLLSALGLAVLVPRAKSFRVKFGLMAVSALAWYGACQFLFNAGYQFSLVMPLLNITFVSFSLIFLGYFWVDRDKAQLRSTMSRYLGEDVTEIVVANPEKLNVGEKREMTVLFSDVRGFTSLSERMPPEVLARFMNGYLTPMTSIVFEEKGTLDKYIGDAIMAFWNAPLDQSDHALRACRAAVKMIKTLEPMKAAWKAQGLPQLDIGIGINTGQMVVGNMGSDVRVDYTVLGDSVNLGSRLEGTNKVYDTRIIVSESTWVQVKHAMYGRRLGAVRVKGKREPVGIFELRGEGVAAADELELVASFENALTLWSARRFQEAADGFRAILARWPGDGPSQTYLAEIEVLKTRMLADDWDGVVSLTTK